jgi:hypothetical protein
LSVRYPVAALRKRLRLAASNAGDESVQIPEPQVQSLALYRSAERELFYKVLDPVAFAVLVRLGSGESLVSACESTVRDDPKRETHIESNVGTWFLEWGQRGFFRAVLTG